MQSQQKKVKWSRGETADALEERTDTGITQVSASKLENIIADIYGNISRRPALKIISQSNTLPLNKKPVGAYAQDLSTTRPATFVFTVNQNKYIILVIGQYEITGFLIENEKFVRTVKFTDKEYPSITDRSGVWFPYGTNASFTQSNNWGVLSGVWDTVKVIRLTDTDDIEIETFKFTAPWYAPNGTQSITVSDADIAGLEFNKDNQGFTHFAWTDDSGISSPYSQIDTGLDGDISQIEPIIPVGSIVKFPNIGAYMRVEGYDAGGHTIYFPETTFDGVLGPNDPVPATGQYAKGANALGTVYLIKYVNGEQKEELHIKASHTIWVANSASATDYSQWNAGSATWSDVPSGTLDIRMFGPLLTPVAASNKKDTVVTVETGYVSLEEYQPMEFVFSQQRLYATRFVTIDGYSIEHEIPGYVVGSQIARYNDFKNDYNTASESVVIDIATAYQEQVVHIADYNGVKILTTDSEYAYSQQNGVVKQSTNGSSPNCRPVVFGSTLLYTDKSKRQIRALQYEFQTDIFQSSVINTMCQDDLIFNPVSIVTQYDKENHTGSFLYVVQMPSYNIGETHSPFMASCNFVPGNQAEIWSRWNIPEIKTFFGGIFPTVVNAVVVNNKPWFVVTGYTTYNSTGVFDIGYTLAELSYDNLLDFEIEADPTDTKYTFTRNDGFRMSLMGWKYNNQVIYTQYTGNYPYGTNTGDPVYNKYGVQIGTLTSGTDPDHYVFTVEYNGNQYSYASTENIMMTDLTLPRATVSVFDGDEYKWDDTLDASGNYTKSLAELSHPRVGFKINAELISHPIDVGGKTYTDHKRIGKCVAVVRDTEAGTFTICDKTGYMDNDKKKVNFYGCTGMKDEVRYTIKNINGAKFTIESLTMIIEYATLDS